jgi:hypothetical protein
VAQGQLRATAFGLGPEYMLISFSVEKLLGQPNAFATGLRRVSGVLALERPLGGGAIARSQGAVEA